MKLKTARQIVSMTQPIVPNGISLKLWEHEKKVQIGTAKKLIRHTRKIRRQNVRINRRRGVKWRARKRG